MSKGVDRDTFDKVNRAIILRHIDKSMSVIDAVKKVGVSRSNFFNYINRHKTLKHRHKLVNRINLERDILKARFINVVNELEKGSLSPVYELVFKNRINQRTFNKLLNRYPDINLRYKNALLKRGTPKGLLKDKDSSVNNSDFRDSCLKEMKYKSVNSVLSDIEIPFKVFERACSFEQLSVFYGYVERDRKKFKGIKNRKWLN